MLSPIRLAIRASARTYSTVPPVVVPRTKRVGTFRGAFIGFLLGITLTSAGAYYYLLEEFTNSNNVIISDVSKMQSSIASLEAYVSELKAKK